MTSERVEDINGSLHLCPLQHDCCTSEGIPPNIARDPSFIPDHKLITTVTQHILKYIALWFIVTTQQAKHKHDAKSGRVVVTAPALHDSSAGHLVGAMAWRR
jgi:hypothetical protein